jgi:acyl-CoA synthetase (AMP-forming)/AMP-acid ligase II
MPNPMTGEVVTAKITLVREEDPALFRRRVRAFCRERLERYKVPAVIEMVDEDHHGARFKKSRKAVAES